MSPFVTLVITVIAKVNLNFVFIEKSSCCLANVRHEPQKPVKRLKQQKISHLPSNTMHLRKSGIECSLFGLSLRIGLRTPGETPTLPTPLPPKMLLLRLTLGRGFVAICSRVAIARDVATFPEVIDDG